MVRRSEVQVAYMEFPYRFERDDEYVYAVCETVPLKMPGMNEDEARAALDDALDLYLDSIDERGELQDAIETFGIKVTTFTLGSPTRFPHIESTGTDGSFGRLALAGNAS